MYLSKVHVAWSKARNPYELHRALWMLFPGHESDPRGFLFRVELERQGTGSELLVQSEWAPENQASEVRVLATRTYLPKLRRGQPLRFRLTSNPVKTIKDEKGRRNTKGEVKSCRVPLIKEDQQLDWLNRKLHEAARLETAVVHMVQPLYFRKGGGAGKVVAVTFDGLLQVVDPDQLWQRMQTGIGPAKGFGCGLLSIAKA
jgi:CRISPR system Cascade subunit CasE